MGVTECRTWAKDATNNISLKSAFSFVNASRHGLFVCLLLGEKWFSVTNYPDNEAKWN